MLVGFVIKNKQTEWHLCFVIPIANYNSKLEIFSLYKGNFIWKETLLYPKGTLVKKAVNAVECKPLALFLRGKEMQSRMKWLWWLRQLLAAWWVRGSRAGGQAGCQDPVGGHSLVYGAQHCPMATLLPSPSLHFRLLGCCSCSTLLSCWESKVRELHA